MLSRERLYLHMTVDRRRCDAETNVILSTSPQRGCVLANSVVKGMAANSICKHVRSTVFALPSRTDDFTLNGCLERHRYGRVSSM